VNAVCLHVRRLHGVPLVAAAAPRAESDYLHIGMSYYQRAFDQITQRVRDPHFFVFSDFPEWARENIRTKAPIEFVEHNQAGKDYEDFWLMTQCRHFVIANSTFSWWAAWLANPVEEKLVYAPASGIGKMLRSIPPTWKVL